MSETPCSCEGKNPDCFRCGGWGVLDRVGKGRAAPTPVLFGPPGRGSIDRSHSARKQKGKKKRIAVACPRCGIATTRLQTHLGKVHGYLV